MCFFFVSIKEAIMTGSSAAAAPHPTAALGAAYNPFAPEFCHDPYSFYAIARRDAPVCWSPLYNVWLVTGRQEITTVLKEPVLFSSADNLNFPLGLPAEVNAVLDEGDNPLARGLFNNDPPAHTRVRVLATSALTPARVAALEPRIRELAHQLIDAFVKDGRADVLSQFAYPIPMTVIADLIGVPRGEMAQVKAWHDDFMKLFTPTLSLAEQVVCARSIVAYQRYYAELIEMRRGSPRDDLVSALLAARLEGERPFSTSEIISQLLILLGAGHETTTNLIGSMLFRLLQEPERWRSVMADPDLIPAAIEETLRFDSPTVLQTRVTTAATELGGISLPKGARLHVFFAAINRDPGIFDDPERFDLRRQNVQRHMALGHGIHFCIGAALARLEGKVALDVILERLPGLRLAPDFAVAYKPSFFFRQPERVDVVWDR
jgi:cytochrome P450